MLPSSEIACSQRRSEHPSFRRWCLMNLDKPIRMANKIACVRRSLPGNESFAATAGRGHRFRKRRLRASLACPRT